MISEMLIIVDLLAVCFCPGEDSILGDFSLGDFNLGDFSLGDFNLGDFSQGEGFFRGRFSPDLPMGISFNFQLMKFIQRFFVKKWQRKVL